MNCLNIIKENIKARFKAKPYNIYTEKICHKGNNHYFIYNDKLYYGNRFFIFFYSYQNYLQKMKNEK